VISNISELDHAYGQQDPVEFTLMLQRVRGAKSILEIGSMFGQTLKMMAAVAAPGARLRCIDLAPNVAYDIDTAPFLRIVIADLCRAGFDAAVLFDNSRSVDSIRWAKKSGPYDFVFIDGDHTYDGVKADWENFGRLGRVVAFHDITMRKSVGKLWREIKAEAGHRAVEMMTGRRLGIGIVTR